MPRWGIHNLVLAEATGRLLTTGSDRGRAAAEDVFAERAAAMLGAVGPDLIGVGRDSPLVEMCARLEGAIDAYEAIGQSTSAVSAVGFDPIPDAVDSLEAPAVAAVARTLELLGAAAGRFEEVLRTELVPSDGAGADFVDDPSIAAAALDPLPGGGPGPGRTGAAHVSGALAAAQRGRFAEALLAGAAQGSVARRAYAAGHIAHRATELVLEPTVERLAGSAPGSRARRRLTERCLATIAVHDADGTSVNRTLFDKLSMPDPFEPLSDDLTDLVQGALVEALGADAGAGPAEPEDRIRDGYAAVHRVLHVARRTPVHRPVEPFSGVADVLGHALTRTGSGAPDRPAGPATAGGAAPAAAQRPAQVEPGLPERFAEHRSHAEPGLRGALEGATGLTQLLTARAGSLPVSVLLALLYGIELFAYEAFNSARVLLCLEGAVTPEPTDLPHGLPDLGLRSLLGTRPFDADGFVRAAESGGESDPPDRIFGNASDTAVWMIETALDPSADGRARAAVFHPWEPAGRGAAG